MTIMLMILSNKEKQTFSHGVTGNTEDFGSSVLGSNPSEKAKKINTQRKVKSCLGEK